MCSFHAVKMDSYPQWSHHKGKPIYLTVVNKYTLVLNSLNLSVHKILLFTCFLLLRASRKWIVNLPFSHEICTDLHFLHPLHVLVLKCWFCPMDLAFLESFSICLLVHNVNHFLKDRWFRFLHFSSQWRSQSKKKSMQLVKIMHVSNLQHNSLIPSNLLLMIWQSIWLIGWSSIASFL